MSVLITDVKMPTCCDECAFVKTVGLDRWKCELSGCDFNSWDVGWADGTENKYIRHSSCPLVEVPPHGRLIEEEPIIKYITDGLNIGRFGYDAIEVLAEIKYSPTIIPAKEGER